MTCPGSELNNHLVSKELGFQANEPYLTMERGLIINWVRSIVTVTTFNLNVAIRIAGLLIYRLLDLLKAILPGCILPGSVH